MSPPEEPAMAKMVESKHSPSTSTEKSTPVVTSGNTERHVEPACDILLTHQLISSSAGNAMEWCPSSPTAQFQ
jgi:hypothetical protein